MTGRDPQKIKDAEHLRLLGVFNFVFAGLSALTALHGVLNIFILRSLMSPREELGESPWRSAEAAGDPVAAVTGMATTVQVVVAGVIVLALILAFLSLKSGRSIRARQSRTFSRRVAMLQCIVLPLGTALGAFTLAVLGRPTVQRLYEEGSPDG